jgi:GntR family transcriptional regulator
MLADRIARREWKPGFAIPNESDLAREFGVSPGTVRKALELMEEGRLVTRRQGKGTFVNDPSSGEASARFDNLRGPGGERVAAEPESARIAESTAGDQECRRLGLSAGATVYRIQRLWRIRGQNVMLEQATLPAALFPGLLERGDVHEDISILAREYGILLGRAEERISVDVPSAAVAATLGVAPGAHVMTLDRVVCMLDGSPVEWRTAHYHLAGGYYLARIG